MIERVKLQNFVSHADTDLPLGDGVTVFVGRNGAGKSSVIDAITYAMYGEHTRGANENLVKRGAPAASASVEFDIGGREYLVERKLNRKGQMEGSVLKEITGGGMRQLAAGERKQFGESTSKEVEKVLGLDYDRMKVAAIVQQGELDSIVVDFSPKQFKELVNSLIGIDQLEIAYQNMLGVTNSFRSYIRDLHGFDDTNIQTIKKTLTEREESARLAKFGLEESEVLLEKTKALESSLDSSIKEMEPLRDKAKLLQNNIENLLEYARQKKGDLAKELADINEVATRSVEYHPVVAEERAVKREEIIKNKAAAVLDRSIVKMSSMKAALEPQRRKPNELLRVATKAAECLLLVEKETGAKEKLDDLEKEVRALEPKRMKVTNELGRLQSQQETAQRLVFKDNKCPVCGSHVEKINPIFDAEAIRKHIREHEAEARRAESEKTRLDREVKALRTRVAELDKAAEYLADNKISNHHDLEKLKKEKDELEKKISKLPELGASLDKAKSEKNELEEKESNLGAKLNGISVAKSYLKEHSTATKRALGLVLRKRDELQAKLNEIPEITETKSSTGTVLFARVQSRQRPGTLFQTRNVQELAGLAFDAHSEQLLSQAGRLEEIASKFDEKEYREKASQLEKLRSEAIPSQAAKVQLYKGQIEKDEEEVRKLTKALGEVQRAGEFVTILTKIRDRVYYRDGPVPSSLRSWALKHIGAKASEYARLFEMGVSSLDLREIAMYISIECYGPRGTIDRASLSGGENVAIALALRFGMAYVMGGYKLDFVVLDEPTIHLDEERKASMVDIISRLGTEDSPLKQVIIITHDAEIFENAEVNSVYRFEATPDGTKVNLES